MCVCVCLCVSVVGAMWVLFCCGSHVRGWPTIDCWLWYGVQQVQLLERHYVGRADRIVIVNAPNFRNIAFLVFPLVPKEVKEKIEILGKNYHKRLAEILVPVKNQDDDDDHDVES